MGSNPLDTPVRFIKGIGPKRAEALAEQGVTTARDLLYYFPYGYLDLSAIDTLEGLRAHAGTGNLRSAVGSVRSIDLVGRPPRQRLVIRLGDPTGQVHLVFFEGINFLKKAFQEGETLAVSGRVTRYKNQIQIVHPMIDRLPRDTEEGTPPAADASRGEGFLHTGGIVPKYGSTRELRNVRLTVRGLRKIMREAIDQYLGYVPEVLPPSLLETHDLDGIRAALASIHFPESFERLERARRRLKFEELFLMQLILQLRKHLLKTGLPGIAFRVESRLARALVDGLPFRLTPSQVGVINEIAGDMKEPRPMNRLLQGDVGSGKTLVALTAALIAVDSGYQALFMAPTEILAEQHFRTLSGLCGPLGVKCHILTAAIRGKERASLLDELAAGGPGITVGTHALIQEDVRFGRAGLVIIDEQHRFGVSQRLSLRHKGVQNGDSPSSPAEVQPDLLVMTATPIPRTLSMTLYGDLDVSVIGELPPGRKGVRTSVRFEKERPAVYQFLRDRLEEGRQVYIVYPLVEESEKLDLKAATGSFEHLRREVFPEISTGLVHGRMPQEERDAVMSSFKRGETRILVSTTVIEVGIDVPNASVMVVEHAERFGLSQLHQLRGRVGRGSDQSYAILMAPDWMRSRISTASGSFAGDLAPDDPLLAVRRLVIMSETTDGFKIAEYDLKMRGPGEFFGTRQSGVPGLRIADLLTDGEILDLARGEAERMATRDPQLRQSAHRRLREVVGREFRELLPLTQSG